MSDDRLALEHSSAPEATPVPEAPGPRSGAGSWKQAPDGFDETYGSLGDDEFTLALAAALERFKLERSKVIEERIERGLFEHYVGPARADSQPLASSTPDVPMVVFGEQFVPREDGLSESKTVVVPLEEYPELERIAQDYYWFKVLEHQRKQLAKQ